MQNKGRSPAVELENTITVLGEGGSAHPLRGRPALAW
jgi:hypothetical protein